MINKRYIFILFFGIVLIILFFLINFKSKFFIENKLVLKESKGEVFTNSTIRYFSPKKDKVFIEVGKKILFMNNPETSLTYFSLDESGNLVDFKDKDRAFVRIIGITILFTNNTEIFHNVVEGVKDNKIFNGIISFNQTGKYLIKICLGTKIGWDTCFEDNTSVEINVYEKEEDYLNTKFILPRGP
jgi:hypothetical protein